METKAIPSLARTTITSKSLHWMLGEFRFQLDPLGNRARVRTRLTMTIAMSYNKVRPWVVTVARKKINPCPKRVHSSFSPQRIGKYIGFWHFLILFDDFLADEDDGQFELNEDGTDKGRRMASASPDINATVPIPEGTSFFCFGKHNK